MAPSLVLFDTSAIFALMNRDEFSHASARRRLAALRKDKAEPILTNFVLAECHALLIARISAFTARQWLLAMPWRIERVLPSDELRATQIIASYTDKDFSYTDATSFAVMERLRISRVFTFDKHFQQYGFDVV